MAQHNTEELATEESNVIDGERKNTRLVNNVAPAVYCSCTRDFGPDDKDEGNVVDPSIDTVEQVIAELGAVR